MDIKLNPELWGPLFWNLLHGISIKFNTKYKIKYYYLIHILEYIIPCPKCKLHYISYLGNNPVELKDLSKEFYKKWFFNLHNDINKRLNKKRMTYKKFNKLSKEKNYINNNNIFVLLYLINKYFLIKKLPFNHFEQIKKFYKILGCIYPDNNIKKLYHKKTNTKKFRNIISENELINWFNENIIH